MYMYKQDSVLNNPQGLIYLKTQPTNLFSENHQLQQTLIK